jgi:hypothetical protein
LSVSSFITGQQYVSSTHGGGFEFAFVDHSFQLQPFLSRNINTILNYLTAPLSPKVTDI